MTAKAITKAEPKEVALPNNVRDFFKRNSQAGAEEIMESLPILRIHDGQSTKNFLTDGTRPTVGNFFHTALKEEWKELDVRLLCIKTCKMPNVKGEMKPTFLIAGVIDNLPMTEFLFYCKGLNYGEMFPFFKEIAPIKNDRNNPIPMFALKIHLTTIEKQDLARTYAPKSVAVFTIVRKPDGKPWMEIDPGTLTRLLSGVEKSERVLQSIIEHKGEVEEDDDEYVNPTPVLVSETQTQEQIEPEPTEEELKKGAKEEINPDDIPF